MQKPITTIFCGNNPSLGMQLAAKLRTGLNTVQLCAATRYIYHAQECERVIIMPDVYAAPRRAIKKVYPKAEDYQLETESVPVPVPVAVVAADTEIIPPTPIRRRRGRPPKLRLAQG